MLEDNTNLKYRCRKLEENLKNKEKEFKTRLNDTIYDVSCDYTKIIHHLEKENKNLNKMIDKFKVTLKKFIKWICYKFSFPSEDQIIRDFEKETYTNFNIEKQLDIKQFEREEKENDYEMELQKGIDKNGRYEII